MGNPFAKPKSTTTTSSSTSSPWEPAQAQLKDILSQAKAEYEKNGGLDAKWIERKFPDLTPEMKSAIGNLAASGQLTNVANQMQQLSAQGGQTLAQGLGQMAQGAQGVKDISGQDINQLSSQLYDSDLVKQQKSQLKQDLQEQEAGQIQALNQRAAQAGAMGSSRAGVTQGVI